MGRKRNSNDNNNKTAAAKIVKQDEENQKVLNPLFMTEILPKILNYLDIDSLKMSRLVCLFWRLEGGKILLKNSNIKLKCFATPNIENSEEREQLENFLNTKGAFSRFNAAIENIEHPDSLKNVLPLLLQRTSALTLNPFYKNAVNENLLEFLEFFPNLQILHLENYWQNRQDFSAETKEALLNKFESLKEIRFKSQEHAGQHLTNLLLTKNQLAVKEMYLQDNLLFNETYLQSRCNWPIDTVVFGIYSLRSTHFHTAQMFLEKIAGSLKHLKLNFVGSQNLPNEYLVPWANNLINPSTYNRLESLFVVCEKWDISTSDYSWLLLTFALQLPNLKKLTLDKVPGNLEERIQSWNNDPDAEGRTLKSESLEELKIINGCHEIPIESLIIFSRRLWPNLKSLWIEYPPNDLPASFLLSEWIGLERLDLKFEHMNKPNARRWKKWLTGKQKPKDGNDSTLTLNDLKDLKHFGLWEIGNKTSNRIATHVFAYSCLQFMTQLQSLYLQNSMIPVGAQRMLKEALGPKVHVQFQYYRYYF